MATFRIIHTRKTSASELAVFEVKFMDSPLVLGDEFFTYDTHHAVLWKVVAVRSASQDSDTTLECSNPLGLGWDDQFAGAIVNTAATSRAERFRYEP